MPYFIKCWYSLCYSHKSNPHSLEQSSPLIWLHIRTKVNPTWISSSDIEIHKGDCLLDISLGCPTDLTKFNRFKHEIISPNILFPTSTNSAKLAASQIIHILRNRKTTISLKTWVTFLPPLCLLVLTTSYQLSQTNSPIPVNSVPSSPALEMLQLGHHFWPELWPLLPHCSLFPLILLLVSIQHTAAELIFLQHKLGRLVLLCSSLRRFSR